MNRPADNAITLEQDAATATRAFSVTCPHDCPDACSMCVTVNSGSQRALKIEGDPRHPVTRGYLCNKVNHYLEYINSPRRMHYPHRRVGPKGPGAKFEGVAWDTALAEIAGRLKAVIAQYGAEAVQPCSYSGTLSVLGFSGMGDRFFNRMGAARLARTICTAAGTVAKFATFGPVSHADIQRIPEMDVVIPWATNIVSTGVHMVPFINEAKARRDLRPCPHRRGNAGRRRRRAQAAQRLDDAGRAQCRRARQPAVGRLGRRSRVLLDARRD